MTPADRLARLDSMVAAVVSAHQETAGDPALCVALAVALLDSIDDRLTYEIKTAHAAEAVRREDNPCTCLEAPGALCPRCHAWCAR